MNRNPMESLSEAKVIFYLGSPQPARTRLALTKLPVSPRTIIYTNTSCAGEFLSRYFKNFSMAKYHDIQLDQAHDSNVLALFGAESPRILTMMDGLGALLAERIWDHVFFESLPIAPFDATKSLAVSRLLANLALKRRGTIIAGINTRNDKDALIFERSLLDAGILSQDIVSFWLNSENNTPVRYLRISATFLANQVVKTQMLSQVAFALLFNRKSLLPKGERIYER